jgi:hypothetical protein
MAGAVFTELITPTADIAARAAAMAVVETAAEVVETAAEVVISNE